MQDWQEWKELPGAEIATDQAWRLFSDWKTSRKEIGMWYVSQLSRFGAFGTLSSATNGTVRVQAEAATATFDLKEARFSYGPMQTWPRWPNPPIVEVMALQVFLPRGTWLVMAEGLKPEQISVPQLQGVGS